MKKVFVILIWLFLVSWTFATDFKCSRSKNKSKSVYLWNSVSNLTNSADKLKCSKRLNKMTINTLAGNDEINTLKSDKIWTLINLWDWNDIFDQNVDHWVLNWIIINGWNGYDKLIINKKKERLVIDWNCADSCKIYLKDSAWNPWRKFKNITLKSIEEIDTSDGNLKFTNSEVWWKKISLIDNSGNKFRFFWNPWLNLEIPLNMYFSWWNNNLIKTRFNINSNNKCYIPLYGVSDSINFAANNIQWNTKFGIYYDCNATTKEAVIQDYCSEIKINILHNIKNYDCSGGIFDLNYWLCSISNMTKIFSIDWKNLILQNSFNSVSSSKNYISILKNISDNWIFYNTYCVNNNYLKDYEICDNWQIKTVKMYDLYDYIKKWAYMWKCLSNNNFSNNNLWCDYKSFFSSNDYKLMHITGKNIKITLNKDSQRWNWSNKQVNYYLSIENTLKDNINKNPLLDITNWRITFNTNANITYYSNVNLKKEGNEYILTPINNQNNIIFNKQKIKIWLRLKWSDTSIKNIRFDGLRFNIQNCSDWIKDFWETVIDGWGPICRLLTTKNFNISRNNKNIKTIVKISDLTVRWVKYEYYLKNIWSQTYNFSSNDINDYLDFSLRQGLITDNWVNITSLWNNNFRINIPFYFKRESLSPWSEKMIWWIYFYFEGEKCNAWINTNPTSSNTNIKIPFNKLSPYMRIDYKNSTIILYYGKSYQINR